MNRRDFIKSGSLASAALFVPNFLGAFTRRLLKNSTHKNLVIIQLSGGNDGLNTIVPYRNDLYYQLRPEIGIQRSGLLQVTDEMGFNQSLKALRALYDNGEMAIISNVGYPNPNRSHFRSMDIWHSASEAEKYLNTGWLGRYLDADCERAHCLVEVGESLSLALKGENNSGVALNNIDQLKQSLNDPVIQSLERGNGTNVNTEDDYLYKTLINTSESARYLISKLEERPMPQNYPDNQFGEQLKVIGQLIANESDSKVYYSSLGGFDTHAAQLNKQERLLENYSESLEAFIRHLKKENKFQDTLIMTFSEFGRRVKENGSKGTDHGTANYVFLFGGSLKKPGLYNELPDLEDLDENGDLKYKVDFRSVYQTILDNWLTTNSKSILNNKFETLGFI